MYSTSDNSKSKHSKYIVLSLITESSGSEPCEGFVCDEWKIILICIAVLAFIGIIVVAVVLLLKKTNGKMNSSVDLKCIQKYPFEKHPPIIEEHTDTSPRAYLHNAHRDADGVRVHDSPWTNEKSQLNHNGIDIERAKSLFV